MIVRIVRMTFREDAVETFLKIFEQYRGAIRGFEGCRGLEFLEDCSAPNALTTLSHWDSEEALERYRGSALFREVWGKTKPLFGEPPSAFSLKSRGTERDDTAVHPRMGNITGCRT